jgi:hypothetical protein
MTPGLAFSIRLAVQQNTVTAGLPRFASANPVDIDGPDTGLPVILLSLGHLPARLLIILGALVIP